MPGMNGFQLVEKILAMDINVSDICKICYRIYHVPISLHFLTYLYTRSFRPPIKTRSDLLMIFTHQMLVR